MNRSVFFRRWRAAYQSPSTFGRIDLLSQAPLPWPLTEAAWKQLEDIAKLDPNSTKGPDIIVTALTPIQE